MVPPEFQFATGLGQTNKINLDKRRPLDTLWLRVRFKFTSIQADTKWHADGILNLLKRITLTTYETGSPVTVRDGSAADFIKFFVQSGGSLDRYTQDCMLGTGHFTGGVNAYGVQPVSIKSGVEYQFMVPICLAHPQLEDPLRLVCSLPLHRHAQNPTLEIQTGSTTDIAYAGTDPAITLAKVDGTNYINVEVFTVERAMNAALDSLIQTKYGGFLTSKMWSRDDVVTAKQTDWYIPIPAGGYYACAMLQHVANSLPVSVVDSTNPIQTIRDGDTIYKKYTDPMIIALNDTSRFGILGFAPGLNSLTDNSTGTASDILLPGTTPTIAEYRNMVASLASKINGLIFRASNGANNFQGLAYLDWLSDFVGPDSSGDLGSLLDTYNIIAPSVSQPDMRIYLNTATVVGTTKVRTTFFRFEGANVAAWQPVKV